MNRLEICNFVLSKSVLIYYDLFKQLFAGAVCKDFFNIGISV